MKFRGILAGASAVALSLAGGLGCGSPGLGESCTQGGPVCRNAAGQTLICAGFGNDTRCTSSCTLSDSQQQLQPNPAACGACSCVQIGADNPQGIFFVCKASDGGPC
jgi:hypothetical protein